MVGAAYGRLRQPGGLPYVTRPFCCGVGHVQGRTLGRSKGGAAAQGACFAPPCCLPLATATPAGGARASSSVRAEDAAAEPSCIRCSAAQEPADGSPGSRGGGSGKIWTSGAVPGANLKLIVTLFSPFSSTAAEPQLRGRSRRRGPCPAFALARPQGCTFTVPQYHTPSEGGRKAPQAPGAPPCNASPLQTRSCRL